MPSRDCTHPGVAGIILAGGRSSRMGFDKLRADVAGTPMLERVVSSIGTFCDEVMIVGGDAPMPTNISDSPDISHVPDSHSPYSGPLAALETGLSHTDCGVVLLCAGDMPFTSVRLGRFLCEKVFAGARAAVPVHPSGVLHPLFAAYERGVLPEVREAIGAGRRSMRAAIDLIGEAGTVEYIEDGLGDFGEPGLMLMNVNSVGDLALARSIVG